MDTTQRKLIMQCWNVIQYKLVPELVPELRNDVGTLKLEKLIHTLKQVRIKAFVPT